MGKDSIYSLFNMGIARVWRPEVWSRTTGQREMPPYSFLLTQNQWRTDTKKDLVQLFKPLLWFLGNSRYRAPACAVGI